MVPSLKIINVLERRVVAVANIGICYSPISNYDMNNKETFFEIFFRISRKSFRNVSVYYVHGAILIIFTYSVTQ